MNGIRWLGLILAMAAFIEAAKLGNANYDVRMDEALLPKR
jgi:hypothetical protein